MMILDAGDLFFKISRIQKGDFEYKKVLSPIQIETYNYLDYQVLNVGNNDLIAGVGFIKDLENKANFPFISSNILDKETGKHLFEPYKIIKNGSNKFGIIGVASNPFEQIDGIQIENPIETLKKYSELLKYKCDYIIALIALNSNDTQMFYKEETGIDMAIFASQYRYSKKLETRNNSILVYPGIEGKYIGKITGIIETDDKMLMDVSSLKYRLTLINRRLKGYKKPAGNIALEEYYSERKNVLKLIENLEKQLLDIQRQLGTVSNPVDFELIPVGLEIKQDKEIHKKMKIYQKKAGKIPKDVL